MAQASDRIHIRVFIYNDDCIDLAIESDLDDSLAQFEVCYHGLHSLAAALGQVGTTLDRMREGVPHDEAHAQELPGR